MSRSTENLTRRTLLRATTASATLAAGAAVNAVTGAPARAAAPRGGGPATAAAGDRLLRELDQKIQAGMEKYGIPGVAVGLIHRGREYLKGYGVTNVDYPVPVDADTVFRVGSTTKTFTGTVMMRLVEAGKVDLDAPVRRYLPDFRTSDPAATPKVTVRHLLNHTAGWLGDYFTDTGPGDDAAARYTAGIATVPQLTTPGTVFAYNNAALEVAGRVIEVVTGMSYEAAVRSMVIEPLGLTHSRYFTDDIIGFNVAASHFVFEDKPLVVPEFFRLWRSLDAAGGLISSARDQLRYARFHLGDGTVPGSDTRLLTAASIQAMRSNPGPGGTLFVELDGMGVTWQLRPTAEGPKVVQHGGDWAGQHSGFMMLPDRGFALTLLTNSEGGPALTEELFGDDWALRRFAGVSNLPAKPRTLPPSELAAYEGRYVQQRIGPTGETQTGEFELTADRGHLLATAGGEQVGRLAFYRRDYVVLLDPDGKPTSTRANFVRGANGRIDWLRLGGRLAHHELATVAGKRTGNAPFDILRPWPLPRR